MILDHAQQARAVGRLHTLDSETGQLRYMAVDPACRGQGLGKQMLLALENAARAQGLQNLVLHAREPVIGFYQHHGYELLKQSHTLFGEIVHYEMHKILKPSSDDSPRRREDPKHP